MVYQIQKSLCTGSNITRWILLASRSWAELCEDEEKEGWGLFSTSRKMFACQTTLADMRPSSRLASLSHLKGSVPAALRPPGTTVAGDKPPCIRAPCFCFSACSCQTTGVPCTDNPSQEQNLLCRQCGLFTIPGRQRRTAMPF